MLFFSIYTKNNEVIAKKRFITVASPSACERLVVLNWRSSSVRPSSFDMTLLGLFSDEQYLLAKRLLCAQITSSADLK